MYVDRVVDLHLSLSFSLTSMAKMSLHRKPSLFQFCTSLFQDDGDEFDLKLRYIRSLVLLNRLKVFVEEKTRISMV
ncbi:hypothetical protein L2E82_47958 [Cichorium intybus]|uniref:Uncharacterized protein n=1 Tax=Cichorium intybus TaxID=13427 RepID=A0ACB8YY72_CICIN|nr:hypothetical protein L2E82_47958 [Cichorium intybus]